MKKFIYTFFVCTLVSIVLCVTVNAQGVWNEDILLLEEMEHELVDMSALDVLEDEVMARSTKSISGTVAAYSHSISPEKVFLAERGIVTINCSYTPVAASVDFGVIAPDGYFYFLNVEGGNINRSIRVNQSGNFAVAIRNNSSNSVRVVGFIEY